MPPAPFRRSPFGLEACSRRHSPAEIAFPRENKTPPSDNGVTPGKRELEIFVYLPRGYDGVFSPLDMVLLPPSSVILGWSILRVVGKALRHYTMCHVTWSPSNVKSLRWLKHCVVLDLVPAVEMELCAWVCSFGDPLLLTIHPPSVF